MAKPLEKLKNGPRIVEAMIQPMTFDDLRRATFLDSKALQAGLARLVKHGYVAKNQRGQWNAIVEQAE